MTYELDPDCDLPPRLLALFLRAVPAQLQGLLKANAARDVEAARAGAHQLKGSLYAVGASTLAALLEALRKTFAAGDWSNADAQLETIGREFESLFAELRLRLPPGTL